jgi:hypothetical protein
VEGILTHSLLEKKDNLETNLSIISSLDNCVKDLPDTELSQLSRPAPLNVRLAGDVKKESQIFRAGKLIHDNFNEVN